MNALVVDLDVYRTEREARELGPLRLMTHEEVLEMLPPELDPAFCEHPIRSINLAQVGEDEFTFHCRACDERLDNLPARCPCGGLLRAAECGGGLLALHCSVCRNFHFEVST